jgi:dTDP-4-dehydrorhamnose reductase
MREIYPRLVDHRRQQFSWTGAGTRRGDPRLIPFTPIFGTIPAKRYGVQLDVRDEAAVHALIRTIRPHTIIHTAGSNRSPDMVNVIEQGTAHVAAAARAVGARLIHLSTDSIFRGDRAPYAETAVGDPVNPYGAAKTAAEETVRAVANAVIVRTSLIYSLQRMDHGTAWMAARTGARRSGDLVSPTRSAIRLPWKHWRRPVWSWRRADYCGVLNVAGRQVLSRAEFAQKLLDVVGGAGAGAGGDRRGAGGDVAAGLSAGFTAGDGRAEDPALWGG